MAYPGQNPRFTTDTLTDIGSGGSAASPQSSSHKLVNRNGVLFFKDSSGNEPQVAPSNVSNIASPNISSGWVASGAGITVATTTTGSDLPLAAIIPTAIKITPVSGTDYVRYRFTMPESLKNKQQNISWFQRPLAGYVSGDLKVDLYWNSASNYGGAYTRIALQNDVVGVSAISSLATSYSNVFTSDASADYYELRIVRVSGTTAANFCDVSVGPGQAATFANVSQGSPGLVQSAGQLLGTNTNDSAASGFVGEYLESVVLKSAAVSAGGTNVRNVTSLAITAGDWDVSGVIGITLSSGVSTLSYIQTAIYTVSAVVEPTSADDRGVISQQFAFSGASISQGDMNLGLMNYRISLSGTVTYYLNSRTFYSGGETYAHYGRIFARRVR